MYTEPGMQYLVDDVNYGMWSCLHQANEFYIHVHYNNYTIALLNITECIGGYEYAEFKVTLIIFWPKINYF